MADSKFHAAKLNLCFYITEDEMTENDQQTTDSSDESDMGEDLVQIAVHDKQYQDNMSSKPSLRNGIHNVSTDVENGRVSTSRNNGQNTAAKRSREKTRKKSIDTYASPKKTVSLKKHVRSTSVGKKKDCIEMLSEGSVANTSTSTATETESQNMTKVQADFEIQCNLEQSAKAPKESEKKGIDIGIQADPEEIHQLSKQAEIKSASKSEIAIQVNNEQLASLSKPLEIQVDDNSLSIATSNSPETSRRKSPRINSPVAMESLDTRPRRKSKIGTKVTKTSSQKKEKTVSPKNKLDNLLYNESQSVEKEPNSCKRLQSPEKNVSQCLSESSEMSTTCRMKCRQEQSLETAACLNNVCEFDENSEETEKSVCDTEETNETCEANDVKKAFRNSRSRSNRRRKTSNRNSSKNNKTEEQKNTRKNDLPDTEITQQNTNRSDADNVNFDIESDKADHSEQNSELMSKSIQSRTVNNLDQSTSGSDLPDSPPLLNHSNTSLKPSPEKKSNSLASPSIANVPKFQTEFENFLSCNNEVTENNVADGEGDRNIGGTDILRDTHQGETVEDLTQLQEEEKYACNREVRTSPKKKRGRPPAKIQNSNKGDVQDFENNVEDSLRNDDSNKNCDKRDLTHAKNENESKEKKKLGKDVIFIGETDDEIDIKDSRNCSQCMKLQRGPKCKKNRLCKVHKLERTITCLPSPRSLSGAESDKECVVVLERLDASSLSSKTSCYSSDISVINSSPDRLECNDNIKKSKQQSGHKRSQTGSDKVSKNTSSRKITQSVKSSNAGKSKNKKCQKKKFKNSNPVEDFEMSSVQLSKKSKTKSQNKNSLEYYLTVENEMTKSLSNKKTAKCDGSSKKKSSSKKSFDKPLEIDINSDKFHNSVEDLISPIVLEECEEVDWAEWSKTALLQDETPTSSKPTENISQNEEKSTQNVKNKRSSSKGKKKLSQKVKESVVETVIDDDIIIEESGVTAESDEAIEDDSAFIVEKASTLKRKNTNSEYEPLPTIIKKRKKSVKNDMGYSQPKRRRKKKSASIDTVSSAGTTVSSRAPSVETIDLR